MDTTEVVVVRHGETVWNRESRMQGHLDSPLNEAGVAQAEAIARRLASEAFAVLYSSDLGRAYRTAQYIAARTGHGIIADSRLRERNLGVFQALTRGEAQQIHPAIYHQYQTQGPDYAVPGGESARQFFDRVMVALTEIAGRFTGRKLVVVTHGGVLDALYRHVLGHPLQGARMSTLLNASYNLFSYSRGHWSMGVWGDISHFAQDALDDV